MNTTRIDQINIGLIIVSLTAAFLLPFQLFLFSYAVLGPLHYLTEIAWLKKHQYFLSGEKDHYLLFSLGILIFLNAYVFSWSGSYGSALIYFAFLSTLTMVLLKSVTERALAFFAIFISISYRDYRRTYINFI